MNQYIPIYFVISLQLVYFCSAQNQFITVVNPGCANLCNNDTLLVYSRLRRDSDSLHIFATVGNGLGDLAVSYVQFNDPNQLVTVSWPQLFSNDPLDRAKALVFSNPKAKLVSKFSFTLTSLIEYWDTSDSVTIPVAPNNSTRVYPFRAFVWSLQQNATSMDGNVTELILSANRFNEHTVTEVEPDAFATDSPTLGDSSLFQNNGSIQLKLQLSSSEGWASLLPRLKFSINNTQMELLLKSLASSLPSARFAIEAALIDGNSSATQTIEAVKNIDDEFTPGIFRMTNWKSVDSCYAQWKPVCYKSTDRTIGNSADVNHSDLTELNANLLNGLNDSFAYALFNGNLDQLTGARATNITFGTPEDKFYANSNYVVWSASAGLGQPPADAVSSLVIILIACGLGLPFLLMSAAVVYLCVRRCRQPAPDGAVSAYQPINA